MNTKTQPVASEPSSGERAQLREFALAWRGYKLNNMSNTAEHIGMLFVHKRNFQNATTPDAIISILDKLDASEAALLWYKHRVDMMQTWQSKMRDPERTIVCDIIANGQTLPDPKGERYGLSSDAKPASEPTCYSELLRGLEIPISPLISNPQAMYEVGKSIASQAKRASEPVAQTQEAANAKTETP